MSAALVNMSGESKIVGANRHEPRFRLLMASLSYLRPSTVSIGLKQRLEGLKAEKHRVTCIAHGADIATDRRNPIIDCR